MEQVVRAVGFVARSWRKFMPRVTDYRSLEIIFHKVGLLSRHETVASPVFTLLQVRANCCKGTRDSKTIGTRCWRIHGRFIVIQDRFTIFDAAGGSRFRFAHRPIERNAIDARFMTHPPLRSRPCCVLPRLFADFTRSRRDTQAFVTYLHWSILRVIDKI